jgi:uncharacterized protein YbjT (DUF2867 family)
LSFCPFPVSVADIAHPAGAAKGAAMILVTGATGLNGSALVRRLAANAVPVRALVRDPAKAEQLAAPGVEIAIGDMARPESLAGALAGVDRAMLNSSATPDMLEVQTNFIAAAAKAGVKHIVKLSGIIPDVHSPFRFGRMHGEIEQRLEQSGMAFTHLRAGEFMHSYFRQVRSILSNQALVLPMAQQRIASIDIDDIAEVAARVLTSDGHESKIYPLTGPEALNMAEVADALSAVTDKTVRYIDIAPEEVMKAQLAAGMPRYTAEALAELFAERRKGGEATVYPDAERLLGRRPTSFAEFAARHAPIFRGEVPPPRV